MKFYLDRLYLLEKAKPSWTISVLRRLVPFKTSSPCNKNWIYQHTSNAHVNLAPYSIRCISERQTRPRWSFCRLPRVQVSLTEIPGGSSRRECGDHLLQRGVVHAAENSAQRPGQIASSSSAASHPGRRLLEHGLETDRMIKIFFFVVALLTATLLCFLRFSKFLHRTVIHKENSYIYKGRTLAQSNLAFDLMTRRDLFHKQWFIERYVATRCSMGKQM